MKKFVFVILAAIAAVFPATQLPAGERINDAYVIHFVLDGLNNKTFNRVLAEGKLPTIDRLFVKNGAMFSNSTSSFPPTSTTIYTSYLTGLLPGHSGIPHLERMDRETGKAIGYLTVSDHARINDDLMNFRALLNPDVREIAPPTTIFELLEGYPTAAIYTPINRGATFAHPKKAPIAALWDAFVSDNVEGVDILAMKTVMKLFGGDFSEMPRYSLVGLYSIDILGHKYGPDCNEVENALIRFDVFLNDFLKIIRERGIDDKTYIIVSADHGMHESGKLFNLQKKLEANDIFVKPKNPRIKNFTLYVANRGVASSQIYVRHDGGFKPLNDSQLLRKIPTRDEKTVDLIDLITKLDATDLLIVRGGAQAARVFGKDSKEALIECFTLNYSDFCGITFDRAAGDPFGYSDDPELKHLLDGKPHSSAEWLGHTAHKKYPDAVIQLSQIFRDGRAGDAFISTSSRYGFRRVKAGNHGSAIEDDMNVPLLVAGPSVPHRTFDSARAVDVFPLLVEWFGLYVPDRNHDGRYPFDEIKDEDAEWQKIAGVEAVLSHNPPLIKIVDVDDFIRKNIYPIAKPSEFKKLLPLAEKEAAERSKLIPKLRGIMKSLELQKTDKNAPRIADPGYLNDHMAMVKRETGHAQNAVRRMDELVTILSGCTRYGPGECSGI